MIKWDDQNDTGNDHVLAIDDVTISWTVSGGTNTSVQFASTSSSVSENAGTTNLALAITNFDASNATNVTIAATGATGRITTFTSPITFPANSGSNENCLVTLNDNLLCDGSGNVTFTITGITGGQGTPTIGANASHVLTVNNDDQCTGVSFAVTSATVSEGVGTYDVVVNITNPSPSVATSADVSLTAGDGSRINGFTTQTVTFPANSAAPQTVTLTVTDNGLCDGNASLTFGLSNLTGGQGTPFIGPNGSRTLTITDNETPANPVATAATGAGSYTFTANWNAVPGATSYFLDVYALSPTASEDFTDGQFTSGPVWTGSTGSFSVLTDGTVPGGAASTDGSFLASNASIQNAVLLTASTEVGQWRFSWASPVFGPSTANHFGIVLMADAAVTAIGQPFNGYYLRIGVDGANDAIELWRSTNSTKTKIGDFPGSPAVATAALTNGLNIRVTRSNSGTFELFYGTGFTYASEPATSAGTLTDNAHSTSSYFGIYTSFANAAATRRNYVDNIVLGGVPTFLTGYNNANVGNVTSVNLTGLDPLTTYYYVVRSTGGCSTGGNSNTISVSTTAVPAYYSQGNGNVNDPIWADAPVGTPGPALWTTGSSMVVQSGDTVTVNGNTNINDLTLEATSRLLIGSEQLLTVHGDQLNLAQFTISPVSGEVELVATTPVTMAVTGTVNFNDLTVNTPAGTTVTGGVGIFGTLLLADGDLDATAATVQLRSDATRTGRLGPVAASADYLGDLTVQRYIPGGATNWRLLGSPVAGATVNGWQDDFITAGYPGSQFPNFQDPPGSGNLWPSIRWYDETNTFADVDSGLVGVSSNLQALVQGQGFAVWCGDNLGGTNPFTIDLTGAPHIASAPIELPLTFTSTGNPTIDGWNLVSNPVPSAVLFSNLARTNVDDYITYYNPATGNSAVYDIDLGFGLNGGTNIIQSGQAFWLKANATSPAVQVEENDKVAGNSGGFFGGSEVPQVPGLRLQVSSDLNTFSDETLVVFAEGSPAVDAQDVTKVILAHPAAPQIGTRGPGNELLAINAYGAYANDIVIPLMVNVGVTGAYTITASTLAPLGLTCLSLEDLATGTVTPIGEGAAYTFTMEADADPAQLRFQLRATAPLPFTTLNATCANTPNGQASVEVAQGPVEVTWTDAFGTVLLQQTVGAGTASFGGLQAGSYAVQVSAGGACAQLSMPFTISAPFELEAVATVADASCPNVADGALDLLVLGGTAPYAFAWSNGATTEDLVAGAGAYTVTVTDANGCAWSSDGLTIASGTGPDAAIVPLASTVLVGQEQLFQAAVVDDATYSWAFGDGSLAAGGEVVHTYLVPGNYTVILTVDDGLCMASSTIDITVELSTGIRGQDRNVFRAWQMFDQLVVELGMEEDGRAVVDVLDATGQLIMQRTAAVKAERIYLPANGLASGVYFIRVTAGRDQRTLRVPVVH